MAQRLRQFLIALAAGALALAAAPAAGAANRQGWALEEHALYRAVPDVSLVDASGQRRGLVAWSRETPLLVTFAYAHCTGVCQPLLRQLQATTSRIGGRGVRYQLVVIGLDPAEPARLLEAFARSLGAAGPGWRFTTAAPAEVTRLEAALGAWSRPRANGQIDHPAVVGAIRDGRLVNAVAGADFSAPRLAVALAELEGGFRPLYPEPGSDVLLRCFGFPGAEGGFTFDWGAIVLVLPGLLAVLATAVVFRPRRRPDIG